MVVSMDRWVGKVAVVTGASAGIGAAIAEELVKEGLKVVGFARRKERIEEMSKKLAGEKGRLFACRVDVTKEKDILAGFKWTIENIGPVSILVNNAGILTNTSLYAGDTALWRKLLETNVLGLCVANREAIKSMRENKIDGHIILMNSVLGHGIVDFPNINLYSPSKFAITSITETLRLELKNLGSKIKVTSISPGSVETEIITASGTDLTLERPFLKPEDIADGVIYALSTPPRVQVHEIIIKPVGEPF